MPPTFSDVIVHKSSLEKMLEILPSIQNATISPLSQIIKIVWKKVLEILASMPELHVLNMSNNHIQRTTGTTFGNGENKVIIIDNDPSQYRRVPPQHDLQLSKVDLPRFSSNSTQRPCSHQCLEGGKGSKGKETFVHLQLLTEISFSQVFFFD